MTSRQARAYLTWVIQNKIDELAGFHQKLEVSLARETKDLRKGFAKGRKHLRPDKRFDVEELHSDEQFLLETTFSRILRYSILLSANTLLESSMNAMCYAEQRNYGYRLGLKDLAGQGATRAKLYLIRVCGVTFPDSTPEWNRMAILGDLRNLIAHADGDVSKATKDTKLKNIVRDTPGLSLRGTRHLEVSREFVADSLSKMRAFFSQLHSGFPAKLRVTQSAAGGDRRAHG